MHDSDIADRTLPPVRRFNLGDAMILVAAAAMALVLATESMVQLPNRLRVWTLAFTSLTGLSGWAFPTVNRSGLAWFLAVQTLMVLEPLSAVFAALTLAVPVLRIRRPRPALRDLLRQPGFIACLAIIAFCLVTVDLWFLTAYEVPFSVYVVAALFLGWVVLGVPPWKRERSWIDRLGRLVGAYWFVMTCATALL
jgi:hypothetical protein